MTNTINNAINDEPSARYRPAALDLKTTTKEQAQALGLDECRAFHPFTKPSAHLLKLLPELYGLTGAGEKPESHLHLNQPYQVALLDGGGAGAGAGSSPQGATIKGKGNRRSKLDFETELDCFGRLVADLAVSAGQWLTYSRKSGWYGARKPFGMLPTSFTRKRMVRLVDRLIAAGLVDHVRGYHSKGFGYQSLVRPAAAFWDALEHIGSITPAEAGKLAVADFAAPLVVVQDEDGNPCLPSNPLLFDSECRKVQALREWMRTFVIAAPVSTGSKELAQVFNSAEMDKGGRYYGWWQNLTKAQRLSIQLNGSPVVELDFRMNHPSILYNSLGLQPPANTYTVPGLPSCMTAEEQRSLAKRTFGRMLNSSNEQGTRWKLGQELGSRSLANHIVDALLSIHRPLVEAGKFWTGIGHELMYKDARIAVAVMQWARWYGAPLLPVHDSFIVRAGDAAACEAQMKLVYRSWMSTEPSIRSTRATRGADTIERAQA